MRSAESKECQKHAKRHSTCEFCHRGDVAAFPQRVRPDLRAQHRGTPLAGGHEGCRSGAEALLRSARPVGRLVYRSGQWPNGGSAWPAFTDNGKKLFDANKPSYGPRAVAPALGNDPTGFCDPLGYVESVYRTGRAFEIVQVPNKIWQIFEWQRTNREIWLDGRQIPEDADPRYYGYAVGHWEGNTLVVHSAAYNDKTWLDNQGQPHDENMTIDEKFVHPDATTIQDTMTITDPTVYVAPLVSAKPSVFSLQLPKGLTELREEYCVPSEEQEFNQNDRDRAAGTAKPVEVK